MRRLVVSLAVATLTLGVSCASQAQETSRDPVQFVPRLDASLGYQFIYANAPPGINQTFNLNGGYASVAVTYKYWLSFAGEFTGTHGNNISAFGQDLTLYTYTVGPRVTFRRKHTVPFVEALFGGAHGGDSYFPNGTSYTTSANTYAIQAGGGLDLELSHGFALRAVEVQYLHTGFNNGVNTSQNQLMVGAGLVFKFHGHYAMPQAHEAAPAPPPVTEIVPPPPPPALPAPVAAAPQPEPPPSIPAMDSSSFHTQVADIYFDYNSADLRPDTQTVILTAAAYLQAHPDLRILVGGYSDERGTPDYNLALGERRATAARNALVQAGVSPDRVSVVSYGKGVQVCTTPAEPCFQRNRRAAFMPQP